MMSKTPMFRLLEDHVIHLAGKEYQLSIIDAAELKKMRLSGYSGLVMTEVKAGKKIIWCTLLRTKSIKLSSEKWLNHMCCNEKDCCSRLSAAKDPKGCACIRDSAISSYIMDGYTRKEAYEIGFRIEKYKFINCAIETFGMNENGFKVLDCQNANYVVTNYNRMTEFQKEQQIVNLAQYLDPTIKSFDELEEKF